MTIIYLENERKKERPVKESSKTRQYERKHRVTELERTRKREKSRKKKKQAPYMNSKSIRIAINIITIYYG
jgi:Na+/phosphate symporter